jgi:hypothetical protein
LKEIGMRKRRPTLAVLFTLTLLCGAARIAAEPACVARYQPRSTAGQPFELRLSGGLDAETARAALAMWGTCTAYGAGFPNFQLEPGPERVISARLVPASGKAICGELRGREIVLYAFARLPNGAVVRCEPVAETLAHELGHVLGLLDAPNEAGCSEHIMAALALGGDRRSVATGECDAVDARWRTASEVWPVEVRGEVAAAGW